MNSSRAWLHGDRDLKQFGKGDYCLTELTLKHGGCPESCSVVGHLVPCWEPQPESGQLNYASSGILGTAHD